MSRHTENSSNVEGLVGAIKRVQPPNRKAPAPPDLRAVDNQVVGGETRGQWEGGCGRQPPPICFEGDTHYLFKANSSQPNSKPAGLGPALT